VTPTEPVVGAIFGSIDTCSPDYNRVLEKLEKIEQQIARLSGSLEISNRISRENLSRRRLGEAEGAKSVKAARSI
jgi:hypothetical protein